MSNITNTEGGAVSGVNVERLKDLVGKQESLQARNGQYTVIGRPAIRLITFAQLHGQRTPAEAREFAQAIIAVANAVEKEGGK